jgi:hypothetical protein
MVLIILPVYFPVMAVSVPPGWYAVWLGSLLDAVLIEQGFYYLVLASIPLNVCLC